MISIKKVIIPIVLIACLIIICLLFIHQQHDPNINAICEMQIQKYGHTIFDYEGVYTNKDKNKINTILKALKNRNRENNTVRVNIYNYLIDMNVKDKKHGGVITYRYTINIDKNNIFITIPKYSDKSYKLDADSAKIIQNFLNDINFEK